MTNRELWLEYFNQLGAYPVEANGFIHFERYSRPNEPTIFVKPNEIRMVSAFLNDENFLVAKLKYMGAQ